MQQVASVAQCTYMVAEPCQLCRAANSKVIQNTFVADEGKGRKKARLSWYHPDDTVSACPPLMLHQHQLMTGVWAGVLPCISLVTFVPGCAIPCSLGVRPLSAHP